MQLYPIAHYARRLKAELPASTFAPARSRLLWLPVHLAIIVMATLAVARGWLPWPLIVVASLVIGVSFAGITFVAHETLHGGIVRTGWLKRAVGWIGFAPFMVSPRLWVVWHNREHHGRTNLRERDPDMYPMLDAYRASRTVRVATDSFALGGRRWTGILSLLLGYTGQSKQILFSARGRGWLSPSAFTEVVVETVAAVLLWAAVAWLVGPLAFLFVYVIPLLLGNVIVMGHILTNHGLSPMTDVNDPLANSLSVTLPRPLEWLTLGFGFHVEHHLFPAMSTRHAPAVRAALMRHWPERYQSMPLTSAVAALHRTARVYRDAETLIDPRTGQTWPTLTPGRAPQLAAADLPERPIPDVRAPALAPGPTT
ncbi:MAG: fatty acid desaturase [Myxococcales bacterium]|nr:fatty acid desaturase [Myxococcales bacterium]